MSAGRFDLPCVAARLPFGVDVPNGASMPADARQVGQWLRGAAMFTVTHRFSYTVRSPRFRRSDTVNAFRWSTDSMAAHGRDYTGRTVAHSPAVARVSGRRLRGARRAPAHRARLPLLTTAAGLHRTRSLAFRGHATRLSAGSDIPCVKKISSWDQAIPRPYPGRAPTDTIPAVPDRADSAQTHPPHKAPSPRPCSVCQASGRTGGAARRPH